MQPLPSVPLLDDVKFPGHGYAERVDDRLIGATASRWGRLAQGQALGKKIVMAYDSTIHAAQVAQLPFFDFGGSDHDAEQIQIVIDSPRALWRSFASLTGQQLQNLSGEYANSEIDTANFPGTAAPIIWPPFSVIVEWGTNARTRAIVDCVNGAKLNVSASWVRAYPLVAADAAANQPGTSAAYVLSAFASPGWASAGNARRTVWLGQILNAGSSGVFDVPPFAKRVTVIAQDPTGAAVTVATIQFWQDPNGATNVGNYLVTGNQPGPFNVPNAAQYFSVLNGAGADLKFCAVFELAIS